MAEISSARAYAEGMTHDWKVRNCLKGGVTHYVCERCRAEWWFKKGMTPPPPQSACGALRRCEGPGAARSGSG